MTKKEEYFKRLENYKNILPSIEKEKNGKQILEILQNPKDKLSLEYSNAYLTHLDDNLLSIATATNEKDNINNIFSNYICSYIKALLEKKSDKELNKIVKSYNSNDYENISELIYTMHYTFSKGPFYIINNISKECNIEARNPITMGKLFLLVKDAQEKLNFNKIISDISKEGMKTYIEFSNYYHEYIQNKQR